jgi:hypothetical protein
MANDLSFVCNLAGRRFKVCLDKPGFCRRWGEKDCDLGIFCKTRQREEYIPAEPMELHLAGNTRCFNKERYPFDLAP